MKPIQLLRWRHPKNQEAFTIVAVDESHEIEQCYSLNCELWPENYGFQFNKANRDTCSKKIVPGYQNRPQDSDEVKV